MYCRYEILEYTFLFHCLSCCFCLLDASTDGIQRGINPEILLTAGLTEVSGPRLLLPGCRVTVIFQYQALSQRKAINLMAELIDTSDGNSVNGSAYAVLPAKAETTQTSCLTLDCGITIPVVRVVRMSARLTTRETLKITNIQFSTDQLCQGL